MGWTSNSAVISPTFSAQRRSSSFAFVKTILHLPFQQKKSILLAVMLDCATSKFELCLSEDM